MAVDLYRGSTNVANLLPADVSAEIFGKMNEASIVQRLARQMAVPGPGLTLPVITGEPTAAWAAETTAKTVSTHTLGYKTLTPKTLAVIEPFSNQFRRDLPGLYAELVRRLPASLAKKFDQDALYGDRSVIGSLYDEGEAASTNANSEEFVLATAYADLLAAFKQVADAGYDADGVAVSPSGENILMGAVSTTGQPLFMPNAMDSADIGNVLGRPTYRSRHIAGTGLDLDGSGSGTTSFSMLGVVGQWDQAVWGTVGGINIAISDQATLGTGSTAVNLFQQNMFAVRAEIEIGFVVIDPKAFCILRTAAA